MSEFPRRQRYVFAYTGDVLWGGHCTGCNFSGKVRAPRCGGTAAYAHSRGVHRQPPPCAAERAVQSSGHRSNDEGLAVQAAMTFEVAAWALSSLVSAIGTKRTSQRE